MSILIQNGTLLCPEGPVQADLLGPQRRMANFTRMLDRWQDAFGKRSSALALLTFMTLIVGAIKIIVPILIMQL